MRTYLTAVLVGFILTVYLGAVHLWATPDKTPPKTASPKALPMLAGPTNWGIITQSGRDLTISIHPRWNAVGKIREDGSVYLRWIESDGREGHGVYQVIGQELHGKWNYTDRCTVEPDGSLKGDTFGDRVFPTKE